MNPRKLLLSNLAWCPGVASAAKFVPDKDVSTKTMVVSASALLMIVSVLAFLHTREYSSGEPENEEGPVGELPIEWMRSFGSSENDRGEHVLVTSDGGYLVVGYNSTLRVGESIYIMEVDSNGTLQWSRTYGDTGWDVGRCAVESEDGYVIPGYANEDLLMMKIDHQGEMMWSRTYGKGSGYAIEETGDGGYAVVGISGDDILLFKTDSDGELLWSRTYGGVGQQHGLALQITSDGGYLIGGITRGDPTTTHWDFIVVKTDSRGEVTWSKTLGGPKDDWLYAVLEASDGGVLAVGSRVSVGPGGGAGESSTWAVKLDKKGEAMWSKTYPGSCGVDARNTRDGGHVILCRLHGDVTLVKIDSEGKLEWCKAHGGSLNEFGACLQVTEDGGYVVTGYHEVTVIDENILLLKVPYLEDEGTS